MNLTINNYINKYVNDNLNSTKYDRNDILVIIANYLNIDKSKLYLVLNTRSLSNKEMQDITDNLNKFYVEKIPLQYITNNQAFFNEKYFVNPYVLIPRQDSEILVEEAIKYINNESLINMLDMCTGSGALGISIANNSCIKETTLVDISSKALEVAKKNIKINNVSKNINIVCSDLFSNLDNKKYDIIVSNPPYIKTDDIYSLDEYVKKEPLTALDGGEDGLAIYRRILKEAMEYLNNNGIIIFEIGYDELLPLKEIIKSHKEYNFIKCVKDLSGNDRVVVIRYNKL